MLRISRQPFTQLCTYVPQSSQPLGQLLRDTPNQGLASAYVDDIATIINTELHACCCITSQVTALHRRSTDIGKVVINSSIVVGSNDVNILGVLLVPTSALDSIVSKQ